MNHREQHLDRALRELRAIDGALEPSPAVEAALQQAFLRHQRHRRVASLAGWAAVAALVLIAVALTARAPQPLASLVARPAEPPPAFATEFIPLRPAPADPDEFSQVIRVRLPRTELRRFGLAPVYQPLDGTVQAEVVLGRDGVAQAVRFVH